MRDGGWLELVDTMGQQIAACSRRRGDGNKKAEEFVWKIKMNDEAYLEPLLCTPVNRACGILMTRKSVKKKKNLSNRPLVESPTIKRSQCHTRHAKTRPCSRPRQQPVRSAICVRNPNPLEIQPAALPRPKHSQNAVSADAEYNVPI